MYLIKGKSKVTFFFIPIRYIFLLHFSFRFIHNEKKRIQEKEKKVIKKCRRNLKFSDDFKKEKTIWLLNYMVDKSKKNIVGSKMHRRNKYQKTLNDIQNEYKKLINDIGKLKTEIDDFYCYGSDYSSYSESICCLILNEWSNFLVDINDLEERMEKTGKILAEASPYNQFSNRGVYDYIVLFYRYKEAIRITKERTKIIIFEFKHQKALNLIKVDKKFLYILIRTKKELNNFIKILKKSISPLKKLHKIEQKKTRKSEEEMFLSYLKLNQTQDISTETKRTKRIKSAFR